MIELEPKNLQELLFEYNKSHFNEGDWYFRGVCNSDFQLLPTIARQMCMQNKGHNEKNKIESDIFDAFKRESHLYWNKKPQNNWEWMVEARHNGLPVRVLDWTTNLLISLYFATEIKINHSGCHDNECVETRAAIYALNCNQKIDTINLCENPFSCNMIGIVNTDLNNHRMRAQSAHLSVQPDPFKSFNELFEQESSNRPVVKIILNNEIKKEARAILPKLGIEHQQVFPFDFEHLVTAIRKRYAQ